ncbi:hypothetical protein [Shinella oryzae]|uniref:Tetracyclin repressor-like C-terminal domain-containing protein n=1 Tax=Shinella oryzae TaxID=2871820 RepID=A0ABY9KAD1_9HYPH|nr:hypothetical protein [Shinella oryzae]WLS04974.1 hypothetical protein Q9315_22630 [Shinella oryzae]
MQPGDALRLGKHHRPELARTDQADTHGLSIGGAKGKRQARSPADRLRNLVPAFLHSEVEEAEVRLALADAAPLNRDAAEAQEIHAEGDRIIEAFMVEALPRVQETARQVAGDLIVMTMTAVGKQLTATPRANSEIDAYADAMSDMFIAYLEKVQSV